MANRYAPYRARHLSREPRTLVCKITVVGDYVGAQTLTNTGPFNAGIVNCVGDADGITTINLGGSSTSRDPYAHLCGVDMISDAADRKVGAFTNVECNHATNPNVAFKIVDTDDANAVFTNGDIVWFRLHFLDSTD